MPVTVLRFRERLLLDTVCIQQSAICVGDPSGMPLVTIGACRGSAHGQLHNIYGHTMIQGTYEGLEKIYLKKVGKQKAYPQRPFIIARGGYAGACLIMTTFAWVSVRMCFEQAWRLHPGIVAFLRHHQAEGGLGQRCWSVLYRRYPYFQDISLRIPLNSV